MGKKIAIVLFAAAPLCHAAAIDRIEVDLLDPSAPRGVVRSFDGSNMTAAQALKKAGLPRKDQAVAVQCEGDAMGRNGVSAFDLFSGPGNFAGDRPDQISRDLRKLGVTPKMRLIEVCWRYQREFERKSGIRR